MAVYKVNVATGDVLQAGTNNSISITLVGSRGESRRKNIRKKLVDDELEILKEHRQKELKARQEHLLPDAGKGDRWVPRVSSPTSRGEEGPVAGGQLGADIQPPPLVPDYVARHWREDDFFGYQFLNGNNPIVIRRCTALPPKFPVTPEMVAPSLGGGTHLAKEMEEGRVFLVDYEVLEGIPSGTIHGRQQHVTAPLCLLHQSADGLLRPIAIQLSQTPGPASPIFLPSDSEWDWLLAKTWVRNADFYSHQLLTHLLRTHLFAEVFAVATLRQLPSCHPLFKVRSHLRATPLVSLGVTGGHWGALEALGVTVGHWGVLERGLESVTYTSLCLPDDIHHRGLSHLPNYHYRDDGLRLWEAIASFVSGIVDFYYGEDVVVSGDTELQAWVMDIFTNGFLGRTSSGIPSSLQTVQELSKFLTMVMFTCSTQHAAVNNGQVGQGTSDPSKNLPIQPVPMLEGCPHPSPVHVGRTSPTPSGERPHPPHPHARELSPSLSSPLLSSPLLSSPLL
uniref:Lipoxygenase domain-containing protein n=1 Tax=Otus sunia TaxID=257818 RepID=A0A8C8B7P4_9STRI